MSDFIVYDVQGILNTGVEKRDPGDAKKWVRDEEWYARTSKIFFYLIQFFQDEKLLLERHKLDGVADVKGIQLKMSDFTEEGKKFIMSQASERWLASFDRSGSKKDPSDTRYLTKQLMKLRDAG